MGGKWLFFHSSPHSTIPFRHLPGRLAYLNKLNIVKSNICYLYALFAFEKVSRCIVSWKWHNRGNGASQGPQQNIQSLAPVCGVNVELAQIARLGGPPIALRQGPERLQALGNDGGKALFTRQFRDEKQIFRRTFLVGPMGSACNPEPTLTATRLDELTELLNGFVSRPRQFQCDVHSTPSIRKSFVRLTCMNNFIFVSNIGVRLIQPEAKYRN
jgi:hypothetical protein